MFPSSPPPPARPGSRPRRTGAPRGWLIAALVALAALPACKRTRKPKLADGGLALDSAFLRIADRLDEAFAEGALPPMSEPEAIADRLAKWKGFRECAARTYTARRQVREKRVVPTAATRLGIAAVEECVVQAAVADRDPALCDRLGVELGGDGKLAKLAAWRCHDTRARLLGLPEECPVLELPGERRGRNPECLAAARRDGSLCAFADDPPRCRAILAGAPEACTPDAAKNCAIAAAYWRGAIPAGSGPPLVEKPGEIVVELRAAKTTAHDAGAPAPSAPLHLRFEAPPWARATSWPRGGGARLALGWSEGLVMQGTTGGEDQGTRALGAGFTVRVAKPAEPGVVERPLACAPDAGSQGSFTWKSAGKPGGLVEGTFEARDLVCDAGPRVTVTGKFTLPILDLVEESR